MKFRILLAATVAASAVSHFGNCQPTPQTRSVAILGFRLGASPAETSATAKANLRGAVLSPQTADLSMGQYDLPGILLGVRITEREPADGPVLPDREYVDVNYSLDPSHEVIYIGRYRQFTSASAPNIQALIKDLTAKYGAFSVDGHWGEPSQSRRLYWHLSEGEMGEKQLNVCGGNFNDGNPFDQMRHGDINYNPEYLNHIYPACGTVMMAEITPMNDNNQLAYSLNIRVGDFAKLQRSDSYMLAKLRHGAAAVEAGQANRAKQNTPAL